MSAWLYILELNRERFTRGATTNLEQRFQGHNSGQACRTTKRDPPVALLYSEEYSTFSEARLREAQVKRWTRAKKEALIAGDLEQLKELAKRRHP